MPAAVMTSASRPNMPINDVVTRRDSRPDERTSASVRKLLTGSSGSCCEAHRLDGLRGLVDRQGRVDHPRRVHERDLKHRQVDLVVRRAIELLPDVGRHADDREHRVGPSALHTLADRILVRPVMPRGGLVDDDDLRRRHRVGRRERPAGNDRLTQDGEVVGRCDEEIHLGRLHARWQWMRFRLEAHREERLLVQREGPATADFEDARYRAKLLLGSPTSTSPSAAP